MSELLELAERCEQATGPDREIDAAIWRTVFDNPRPATSQLYTASLDAAMTLVPEGWGWRLWMPSAAQNDRDRPSITIWGHERKPEQAPRETTAATPALALCAAALRAKAAAPHHPGSTIMTEEIK